MLRTDSIFIGYLLPAHHYSLNKSRWKLNVIESCCTCYHIKSRAPNRLPFFCYKYHGLISLWLYGWLDHNKGGGGTNNNNDDDDIRRDWRNRHVSNFDYARVNWNRNSRFLNTIAGGCKLFAPIIRIVTCIVSQANQLSSTQITTCIRFILVQTILAHALGLSIT